MRRTALLIASAVLLISVGLCGAQTDAETVKATLEALLANAKAGDADAAADHVHELLVAQMDLDDGMMDRQRLLESIETDPAPAGMSFGDYEPRIYGGVACVLAPLSFAPGEGPPADVKAQLDAVLLRSDAGWRVLAMCLLVPDLVNAVPEEAKAQAQAFVGALETFGRQLGDAGASGDARAFFDLCLPEGVVAGPYGPDGAVVATRVSDLAQMVADMPKQTMTPADEPDGVSILGLGCAWLAVTATVQAEGAQARVCRHVAIVSYIPAEQAIKIIAAVEAPLAE